MPTSFVYGRCQHMPDVASVLVVDDFELFRRAVCLTLEKIPGLQVVGEVSDGLEAVRRAEELQPDLILLDVGLPSLGGMEAARRIRWLSPASKIIFVSLESSAELVQEALSIGAVAYVMKMRVVTDLLAAIDAALEDRLFLSAALSGQAHRQ